VFPAATGDVTNASLPSSDLGNRVLFVVLLSSTFSLRMRSSRSKPRFSEKWRRNKGNRSCKTANVAQSWLRRGTETVHRDRARPRAWLCPPHTTLCHTIRYGQCVFSVPRSLSLAVSFPITRHRLWVNRSPTSASLPMRATISRPHTTRLSRHPPMPSRSKPQWQQMRRSSHRARQRLRLCESRTHLRHGRGSGGPAYMGRMARLMSMTCVRCEARRGKARLLNEGNRLHQEVANCNIDSR